MVRMIWLSRSEGWNIAWWKKTVNHKLSQIYKRLMMIDSSKEFHKKLRYFFISLSLLSFILLAFTGIIPVLILNQHITGILLIIHVTVAPVFVVALAMTALFWAHFQQFDGSDLAMIKSIQKQEKSKRLAYHLRTYWLKVFFWIFLAFSIPASLSMIFSMFPLFGTDGLNTMLNIHQYATLGLLIVAFFYTDFKLVASNKRTK